MLKTKLFKLLLILDKGELRDFRDFVASPYFNKNKKVIALYEFIYRFADDFENPKMSIEAASHHVFGKKENVRDELYKLFFYILDLLQEFISQQEFKKNDQEKRHKILKFLIFKDIEPMFRSELEKMKKKSAQNPLRNEAYYYNDYRLHQLDYDYAALHKKDNQLALAMLSNQALNNSLIYNKLDFYNQLTYHNLSINIEVSNIFDDAFMESVLNSIDLIPEDLKLQANLYKMLKTPSLNLYESNLKDLDKIKEHFDNNQLSYIIAYLGKILIQFNLPTHIYHQKLLLLYKWRVHNNLLLAEGGFIQPFIFRNIIVIAINTNELAYAKFIHKKYALLIYAPFQEKNNMIDYSAAIIAFAEKNYEEALTKCNQIYAQHIELKLDERVLRIKIYYELAYFDLFEDSINSYRKFLSDNKKELLEKIVTGMRNFTNFTHRIFRANVHKTTELSKLQAEIEALNFLPEKVWLLEKISEKNNRK
jgi:hypothetical protein